MTMTSNRMGITINAQWYKKVQQLNDTRIEIAVGYHAPHSGNEPPCAPELHLHIKFNRREGSELLVHLKRGEGGDKARISTPPRTKTPSRTWSLRTGMLWKEGVWSGCCELHIVVVVFCVVAVDANVRIVFVIIVICYYFIFIFFNHQDLLLMMMLFKKKIKTMQLLIIMVMIDW